MFSQSCKAPYVICRFPQQVVEKEFGKRKKNIFYPRGAFGMPLESTKMPFKPILAIFTCDLSKESRKSILVAFKAMKEEMEILERKSRLLLRIYLQTTCSDFYELLNLWRILQVLLMTELLRDKYSFLSPTM